LLGRLAAEADTLRRKAGSQRWSSETSGWVAGRLSPGDLRRAGYRLPINAKLSEDVPQPAPEYVVIRDVVEVVQE